MRNQIFQAKTVSYYSMMTMRLTWINAIKGKRAEKQKMVNITE
jgi:hypothetical protein